MCSDFVAPLGAEGLGCMARLKHTVARLHIYAGGAACSHEGRTSLVLQRLGPQRWFGHVAQPHRY